MLWSRVSVFVLFLVPRRRKRNFDEMPVSNVMDEFITQIGRGETSVAASHRMNNAMKSDGVSGPAVEEFSKIRTGGNTERDLTKWLSSKFKMQMEVSPVLTVTIARRPAYFQLRTDLQ